MDIPFNTFLTKSLINTMGKPLEKSANFSILVGPEKKYCITNKIAEPTTFDHN